MAALSSYQPDPDDSEIFFGPCQELDIKSANLCNRRTLRRSEVKKLADSRNSSDEENDSLEFEPLWKNFEEDSLGNLTVKELRLDSTSSEQSTQNCSSLLNSAFIAEQEVFCDNDNDNDKIDIDKEDNIDIKNEHEDSAVVIEALNVKDSEVLNWAICAEDNNDLDCISTQQALCRIENTMAYFRNKFNLQTPTKDKVLYEQEENCGQENDVRGHNDIGDRTLAFVKQLKSATGNSGGVAAGSRTPQGFPAFLSNEKKNVKITPVLNEKESLDGITSTTPLVIKHLKPMSLSSNRSGHGSPRYNSNNSPLGSHNLPVVSRNTKKNVALEPVVVKRALKY